MNIIVYTFVMLLLPAIFKRQISISKCDISPINIKWSLSLVIAFIITVLIRGLAYNTGRDWLFYSDFISDASAGLNNPWSEHTEWLFRELVIILGRLQLFHYTFFIIVSALVIYSLIKISSLYGKALPCIMIIWYPILFLLSLNLLRQYLAISFVYLFVYFFIMDRKSIAYICLIVGILFHTSAIFALIFIIISYFLSNSNKKISVWFWIILIVFSTVATNLFLDSLLNIGSHAAVLFMIGNGNVYDVQSFSESMYGTSYTWIMMLVNITCVYLSDKIKDRYSHYKLFHYITIMSYILYPVCQQELLSRILLYTQMFIPITLGVMFIHYKKEHNLSFKLLCCVFLAHFTMFFYYLNEMSVEYPYQIQLNNY